VLIDFIVNFVMSSFDSKTGEQNQIWVENEYLNYSHLMMMNAQYP